MNTFHSCAVVITASGNADLVADKLIREPMLIRDVTRPVSIQPMPQYLGLSDALVSVASNVFAQYVDARQRLAIWVCHQR